ncbi:MAG: glucosaminidase domain-containing protein [Alphaproteobacteria bacterium]|nr:glucosaminidase domain-containing protein [Alphaproteobacteria bacterium]
MKYRLIFIMVCCVLGVVPYLIYQKHMQSLTAPDVVPELFQTTEHVEPTAFATTQAMAEAFQVSDKPIYILSFPTDFDKAGTPELFVQALLPYVQWYNRQISAERQELIAIANKLWAHLPLTQAESDRFAQLANLYGERGDIDPGTAYHLLEKINVIPPAVALTVALQETEGGKKYLDAPFGVFVWDENNRYVRAAYPDLEQAYYAWLYQLNTADAHAAFRAERQQERGRGYSLLSALRSLSPHDGQYTDKLAKTYKQYQLISFEEQ